MKSIFTFVLACITSIVSYADYRPSSLTVSSAANHRLVVMLDNEVYQSDHNYIAIRDLSPGYHHVKVYRHNGRNNGRMRSRDIRNADLLYSTSLQLRPRTNVEITINRFGQASVREQFNNRRNNRNSDWDDRFDNRSRDRSYDDYDDRYNRNERDYERSPVSLNRFVMMISELRRENFENSRMRLARQMLSSEFFNTKQVEAILNEFSFEQNKLELAKFAYSRVTDRDNYYVVSRAFSFDSSKRALEEYVRRYRE